MAAVLGGCPVYYVPNCKEIYAVYMLCGSANASEVGRSNLWSDLAYTVVFNSHHYASDLIQDET